MSLQRLPWTFHESCISTHSRLFSKKWLFRTFTMDFFIKSYISTHSRLFWKKNDSFGKCLQRFIPQLTFKLLPWKFTGTPWRTLIYFLRQGFFNNRTVFYFPELIWMTVSIITYATPSILSAFYRPHFSIADTTK